MNASNASSAVAVVECCKIWPTPDGVISGCTLFTQLQLLLAALFFLTLSVQHKIVEFIQDEKLGFDWVWCPPFMCIFIGVDT